LRGVKGPGRWGRFDRGEKAAQSGRVRKGNDNFRPKSAVAESDGVGITDKNMHKKTAKGGTGSPGGEEQHRVEKCKGSEEGQKKSAGLVKSCQ